MPRCFLQLLGQTLLNGLTPFPYFRVEPCAESKTQQGQHLQDSGEGPYKSLLVELHTCLWLSPQCGRQKQKRSSNYFILLMGKDPVKPRPHIHNSFLTLKFLSLQQGQSCLQPLFSIIERPRVRYLSGENDIIKHMVKKRQEQTVGGR